MEIFGRLATQLKSIWTGMSQGRRILLVSTGVLTLLVLAGVAYWTASAEYQVVRRGLTSEQIDLITQRFEEQDIPYRLDSGGTSISVPLERLAQARVNLAATDLPSVNGKGWEIFDDSPMGMTPFVQNVNYMRALQSELARTITAMDPIAQARIHIVRPAQTPFLREQKPTTASVVLRLKPGKPLPQTQAQSIVALVARAVEGLTPDNVALVDTEGRLLSDMRSEKDRIPSAQLEFRRELERYLSSKAEDMLRRSVGAGRAVVEVTADINFKRVREIRETFSAQDRVIREEELTTQKSANGSSPRGVAGSASNGGRSASSTGSNTGTSQQDTTKSIYDIPKSTLETEQMLSSIDRITVAAMVDLSEEEGAPPNRVRLTLPAVEELIKGAIGFKEGRDLIKVSNVHMIGELPPEEAEDTAQLDRIVTYVNIARTVSLLVGLLLLLVLGILVLKRMGASSHQTSHLAQLATDEMEQLAKAAENDPARLARVLTLLMEKAS